AGRRSREITTFGKFGGDGLNHSRIRVSQYGGPQSHAPVEELVSVDVPRIGTLGMIEETRCQQRKLVVAFAIGVSSAWNSFMRPGAQFVGMTKLRHFFVYHAVQPPSTTRLCPFK